eukprot:scaffold143_cov154-Amphora_coffeaeformis.AAC.2
MGAALQQDLLQKAMFTTPLGMVPYPCSSWKSLKWRGYCFCKKDVTIEAASPARIWGARRVYLMDVRIQAPENSLDRDIHASTTTTNIIK